MIGHPLLMVILIGEALVLVAATSVFLGHAIWLGGKTQRSLRRLTGGRQALAAALDGEGPIQPGADLLGLPLRLRRSIVVEIAPNLSGRQRERLAELAEALGVLDRGRRWLSSRWWWRRLWAAHLLSMVVDEEPGFRRLLDDPHPEVRAQAIDWAGDHADAAAAERLIALLADLSPLCRATAKDSLVRAGLAPVPFIARHLERERGDSIGSLIEVATRRPDSSYGPAAVKLSFDERPGVRAGAAALLGAVGGTEGAGTLERLLADSESEVRESAVTSVGKLGHWPAASAVALLLRDREWTVRKAAGQALIDLGAPGMIMLRRYSDDDDKFAADMARMMQQVAQLHSPGGARPAARLGE